MSWRSVLVVAAHPDDEVLGCGGTIARLSAEGAEAHVAFLADGESSRGGDGGKLAVSIRERHAAAAKACAILGAASTHFLDFPDNQLDGVTLLSVVQRIEELIAKARPDMVITHHAGDLNVDHRRAHEATVTACRPQPGQGISTMLSFEVPSSTDWQPRGSAAPFVPDWYFNITAFLERKLAALDAYANEIRHWPHPRSREGVVHLARWRGATIGVEAAEAFMLGRQIS